MCLLVKGTKDGAGHGRGYLVGMWKLMGAGAREGGILLVGGVSLESGQGRENIVLLKVCRLM